MNRNEITAFIAREQKEAKLHTLQKSYKDNDFTTGDNGTISGYFATFDHDTVDSYGDVIKRGAFLETFAAREKTGHPYPLLLNHEWNIIIGRVIDVGEDKKGAYFTAEFFPTEKAQEIRNIVKSGVLWQFSFAYNVLDSGRITLADGTEANELRKLDLFEISVVLVPANPRAVISDVKNGKQESKRELLRTIHKYEARQNRKKEEMLDFINSMKQ